MSTETASSSVKAAIHRASLFLSEVYGDKATDTRLEEVEYLSNVERSDEWAVTLSFRPSEMSALTEKTAPRSTLESIRQYKTIYVGARTGNVTSMKIRQLQ
jgi:hypothetical protein